MQFICGKEFAKFYRQNFCYQCFWNAPQASPSIFKPELCTADLGIEERDIEWEKQFQLVPHLIYLANSSSLKVGVTRKGNELIRWMDQGAVQAIVVAEVPNRRLAGLVELELKKHIADKTNWRIVQLPNGYFQTEYKDQEEAWQDVTRRETMDGAEAAIDGSIEHYTKKLEFVKGPKVVKTFE